MSSIKNFIKSFLPEKLRLKIRKKFKQSIHFIYLGKKYTCNCCGKSFNKFLSKGRIERLNAECPYCFSLERTRVLDLFIKSELDIYNSETKVSLLHLAPENILYKKLSKIKSLNYIDGDINPALARYEVDLTHINFSDSFFNYIICSHVLGHIPDENTAIKELFRVLKPKGKAIILTFLDVNRHKTFEDANVKNDSKKMHMYAEPDLVRLHGLDFLDTLKSVGFGVELIDYRLNFSEEFREKHRLGDGDREKIILCTKHL